MGKLTVPKDRMRSVPEICTITESNRPLNTLLDALRDVVLYFDRYGVVQHANARAADCFGPNCKGKTFIELAVNWENSAERHREIMQVIRNGASVLNSRERAIECGAVYWYQVNKFPLTDQHGQVDGAMLVITDITHSVRREQAIKESEARYRAFIASSSDAIWRYDICPPIDIRLPKQQQVDQIIKRAVIAECNDRLVRLYGVKSQEDLIGLPIHHNGSKTLQQDLYDFVCNDYRLEDRDIQRTDANGHLVFMQSSAIGMVENGFLTRAWGTTRDITEKRVYLSRLEYLANYDVLTGLPNRSVLYRKIGMAINQRKPNQKMALLLIDLDRFKEINDTLGHVAGDKVLKQLAKRLEVQLAEVNGLVARLGGDEFAVFLPKIRNSSQAVVIAHKLLDAISESFVVEGLTTEISASIGVSVCPDQAVDNSGLMRFADVAMYRAKTCLQGVAVYDAGFDPHSPKRLELIGALGRAIREDQLVLFFQPKVCLRENKLIGFEALLRWDHPELGFIPPSEFIPIAEHSNLINPLTIWVMDRCFAQCREWLDRGVDVTIAINLSARNLLDDRMVVELRRLLFQYKVPSSNIELEITESTIMADPARAESALDRINKLGVKLSVDDFGTGYSSLSYLKRLPVKSLKIDSSFVCSMLNCEHDQIIVNSIVHLAHNLGLSVVAEGVESYEIFQKLAAIGCDCAQGYYLGHPMDAGKALAWIDECPWKPSAYESTSGLSIS